MNATCERKAQRAREVLQLWKVMEFADQAATPSTRRPKDRKSSDKSHHDGSCGVNLTDPGTLSDALKSRMRLTEQECLSTITVTVGAVSREACINLLERCVSSGGRAASQERPERNPARIGLAELTISAEGALFEDEDGLVPAASFRLSPLLWLAAETSRSESAGLFQANELRTRWEAANDEARRAFAVDANLLCDERGAVTLEGLARLFDKVVRLFNDALPVHLDSSPGGQASIAAEKTAFAQMRIYANENKKANDKDYTPPTFWNSFFYNDLEMASERIERGETTEALLDYIVSPDASEGRRAQRLDVLFSPATAKRDFYREALSPANIPLGRWPSQYSPALLQQLAVNLCMKSVRDKGAFAPVNPSLPCHFSVNGPSGTGKTTLLKDVVAACVVEKAKILAAYENPDDAFERIELNDARSKQWHYVKTCYRMKTAGTAANDPASYGIVVCSANNAAVENISKELPKKSELLKSLGGLPREEGEENDLERTALSEVRSLFDNSDPQKPRYLRDQAALLFGSFDGTQIVPEDDVWGLIAAPLGKGKNILDFRNRVLFPKSKSKSLALGQFKNREDALQRYKDARTKFLKQLELVESMHEEAICRAESLIEAEKALERERALSERLAAEQARAEAQLDGIVNEQRRTGPSRDHEFKSCVNGIDPEIVLFGDVDEKSLDDLAWKTQSKIDDLQRRADEAERFLRSTLNRVLRRNLYAMKETELADNVQRRERLADILALTSKERIRRDEERSRIALLQQKAHDARAERIASNERMQEASSFKDQAFKQCVEQGIRPFDEKLAERIASGDPAEREKAHLASFWLSAKHDRAREKLFAYAFEMETSFVEASEKARRNMALLAAMWGEKAKPAKGQDEIVVPFTNDDRDRAMPHLLQTLLLAVPVVSTTFASVEKMFSHVKDPGTFGLLVVDEAGQATPRQAVGMLHRCRRALIVGDPKQVEPVVTNESILVSSVFPSNLNAYARKSASVQEFADRLNPIGSSLSDPSGEPGDPEEPDEWVGSPLLIHRRCLSPMFDISNELSYSEMMHKKTAAPKESAEASFCLASSFWLDVRGSEIGNKNHFVKAQAHAIEAYVRDAFEKAHGEQPSLFLITPFSSVASELKKHFKKLEFPGEVDRSVLNNWVENCIGTVHTFQGKEANEVFFVLGCDGSASGAVRWVNANIVNVAVTRAKYRLCAVGDETLWNENPSVALMRRHLDTWWAKQLIATHADDQDDADRQTALAEAMRCAPHADWLLTASDPEEQPSDENDEREIRGGFFESFQESGLLSLNSLSDDDFQRFGFEGRSDFDRRFADCPDVASFLLVGMTLYLLFKLEWVAERDEEDPTDYSFCAIGFCKAAERYLRTRYIPLLKRICPDYKKSNAEGARPLSEWKEQEFTLGTFENLFTRSSRGQAQALAKISEPLNPRYSEIWWNNAAKLCEQARQFRNDVCHDGPVTAQRCQANVGRLVGLNAERFDQWPLGILREEEAPALLERALNSKPEMGGIDPL